jgi:hypothetical protein
MHTIDFEIYEFQDEFDELDSSLDMLYPYGDTECASDDMFDELWTKQVYCDPKLLSLVEETIQKVGYKTDFSGLIDQDMAIFNEEDNPPMHYIMSVVGDDEHTTTNSVVFAVLCICMASFLSGIKISWKDVGISPIVGNYAEGWLLIPPTSEASLKL